MKRSGGGTHRTLAWRYVFPVLLAFGLRVYHLGYQSLWEDEVHSVVRGNLPLSLALRDILSAGNQAPLYFLTMHFWQFLGDDALIVRFFSVICGTLATAMLVRLSVLIQGRRAGLAAPLLLAISPLHIWYSQETRMYSLVILLAIAGNYLFLRAIRRNRSMYWLGYAACILALVYTHYLTSLMVVAHFIFLFVNRRCAEPKLALRHWTLSMAMVGLTYLPWLLAVAQQADVRTPNTSWISPVHWADPLLTLYTFALGQTSGGDLASALGFSCLLGGSSLAIAQIARSPHCRAERLVVHWLLTPLLLLFLASWASSRRGGVSLFVDRYLLFVLPAFLLLAAWGLDELRHRSKLLACIAMAMVLVGTSRSLCRLYFDPSYHRENWRDAVAYLGEGRDSGDMVIISSDPHFVALGYYQLGDVELRVLPLSSYARDGDGCLSENVRDLRLSNGLPPFRYWVISGLDNLNIHGFPQQRNTLVQAGCSFDQIKAWFDGHYPLLEMRTLNGICLSLYGQR
jgi:mannosyltransferase